MGWTELGRARARAADGISATGATGTVPTVALTVASLYCTMLWMEAEARRVGETGEAAGHRHF